MGYFAKPGQWLYKEKQTKIRLVLRISAPRVPCSPKIAQFSETHNCKMTREEYPTQQRWRWKLNSLRFNFLAISPPNMGSNSEPWDQVALSTDWASQVPFLPIFNFFLYSGRHPDDKVLQLNHMLMKIRLLDLNNFYIVCVFIILSFKIAQWHFVFLFTLVAVLSAKQLSVNLPSSGEFNDYTGKYIGKNPHSVFNSD